jgi:hydrogenase maturation protease
MGVRSIVGFENSNQVSKARPVITDDSDTGRVTVLGIGNILLSDEGVGVHVIDLLKEQYAFSPGIDLIDGGTMGLDLLPLFQIRDKILIIDAVDFGKKAGHVGVLNGNDIPSVLNSKLSVHHIGLSDVLFAAKLMRETPPEVCLVGVQPKYLDVGLDMTHEVQEQLPTIIDHVLKKLKDWNIECVLQSPQKSSA